MDFGIHFKKYFKRDISYGMFKVLIILFAISVMFRLCYIWGCGIIPFWEELVPKIEIILGFLMFVLILGIFLTELS